MEALTDFIGFLIILGAIILNFSQMFKKKKPKPVNLEPEAHPEIQKRIPTGRAQKRIHHEEEELVKAPPVEPIPPVPQAPKKPLTAKEMMIHYEIFSLPKAFRQR